MRKWGHLTFGRLREFDERSWNYRVRKLITQEEPITKEWEFVLKPLDQKAEPRCVGYAGAHQAIATPVPQLWVTKETADEFYYGAQRFDEWPGEDYAGSSGLGLLKYWLNRGFCTSGYWSFSLLERRLGIAYNGPALVGCSWMTGMMDVDSNGFIHANGLDEGGHETLWLANNEEEEYMTILNSWYEADGTTPWGQNGRAKISYSDVEKLMSNSDSLFIQGEKGEDPQPPPPEPDPGCSLAKAYFNFGLKHSSTFRSLVRKGVNK